ncbi:APC family permease [Plantibacter flavus]|uniref:APC family permease n=1 Tax=Plantibacter flavus TaxID=150123 RepID=UPI003F1461BB
MIGAGVFAVFAPAAEAAGGGLLIALVIAAVVAFCNATSSAQLAAQYPSSGGTYLYGRERLGRWWGFAAGWSFVLGKTASCAAMAMTFAAYTVPAPWQRPVAVVAVLALGAVNLRGVTRTAGVIRIIVAISLASLAVFAIVIVGTGQITRDPFGDGLLGDAGPLGVLQAAGLLFFAFAGYARIATMGEEVRDPAKTIPRAIVIALGGAVVLYAVVAMFLLGALGVPALAASTAPVADAARASGVPWLPLVVQLGAAAASLGALLGLMTGIGRTALAMARNGDLPRGLAVVHPRFQVPQRAELALVAVVCVLVLVVDLREVIGYSSFGVLLYYFVTNLAALTQSGVHRRYPRALQVLGLVGCALLVVTVLR